MDQVGYVVRHVTDDGFLLLDGSQGDRRNGPERRHPVGQPVKALARDGTLARGHARRRPAATCSPPSSARSTASATTTSGSSSGCATATPCSPPACTSARRSSSRRRPAQSGELLVGPSMDNRVGLAADGRAARRRRTSPASSGSRATVQEENGLHGARALAPPERFDAAIALDVGLVGDIPSVDEKEYATRPRRRADRRAPRHRHRLRPHAVPAPARARVARTTSPRRTGCSPATAPTASRSPRPARPPRC